MSAQVNGGHGDENDGQAQTKKINQFGDYDDVTDMSKEDWVDRWERGHTKFHLPKIHPMLEKHYDKMTEGRKKLRIFLPLCGKSLDLKWLEEQGHEVVGCDCAELCCKAFFEENNIPFSSSPLSQTEGVIYKATDGRNIQLYVCDFFALTREIIGEFDCIWDRGSFAAIGSHVRERYLNTLVPLMKPDTRYMLESFVVDNDNFGGPPFKCTEEDIKEMIGKRCSVDKIDEQDVYIDWQKEFGLKYFVEEVYIIMTKC